MNVAIWIGLIYNNKRLDDFKGLLRSEVGGSEGRMLRAMAEMAVQK